MSEENEEESVTAESAQRNSTGGIPPRYGSGQFQSNYSVTKQSQTGEMIQKLL
jgi:hypothetical protein